MLWLKYLKVLGHELYQPLTYMFVVSSDTIRSDQQSKTSVIISSSLKFWSQARRLVIACSRSQRRSGLSIKVDHIIRTVKINSLLLSCLSARVIMPTSVIVVPCYSSDYGLLNQLSLSLRPYRTDRLIPTCRWRKGPWHQYVRSIKILSL